LEENQRRRRSNIQAYTEKILEVQKESSAWSRQKEGADELIKAISTKEKDAEIEKGRWLSKLASYKKEITKWKKESKKAESQYRFFKKLGP